MLIAAIILMSGSFISALDFNDVVGLKQNGISDEVLVNMVHQGGGFQLTQEQEHQLRGLGVGDNLIVAIRSTPRVSSPEPSSLPAAPQTHPSPTPTATPIRVIEAPQPVIPLPVTEPEALPARFDKEGWLSISNSDMTDYYLNVDVGAKRLFLSRIPNGGFEIPPGSNRVINIRKETYKLYGDSGRRLEVKVRENEVTRLSLIPFGVEGNSGLTGVVKDRDRVRSEALFDNYVPPPTVIVQPAPVVVVPEPYPYYYAPRPRPRGYHFGFGW